MHPAGHRRLAVCVWTEAASLPSPGQGWPSDWQGQWNGSQQTSGSCSPSAKRMACSEKAHSVSPGPRTKRHRSTADINCRVTWARTTLWIGKPLRSGGYYTASPEQSRLTQAAILAFKPLAALMYLADVINNCPGMLTSQFSMKHIRNDSYPGAPESSDLR